MIPIIMYHAIGDTASPLFTSVEVFEAQLRNLAASGNETITLGSLLHLLRAGKELPEKKVVLTFDDGYESVYTEAWPRLREHGFNATVFLVSDYCGRTNQWPSQPGWVGPIPLMTWAQAAEMADEGCEFGAHTQSHPPLPALSTEQITDEIVGSQRTIRHQLGPETGSVFAQPYGATDARVDAIISQHFAGAVGTELGWVYSTSDPFKLARIDAYYWRPQTFPHMHSVRFRAFLAMCRNLRAIRRWFRPDWQMSVVQ